MLKCIYIPILSYQNNLFFPQCFLLYSTLYWQIFDQVFNIAKSLKTGGIHNFKFDHVLTLHFKILFYVLFKCIPFNIKSHVNTISIILHK